MSLVPGKYYPGSTVRLTIDFVDDQDVYVNPTTVVARSMSPSGTEATYTYGTSSEMGRTATGRYYVDITPTEFGQWTLRWQATGPAFATETRFNINYSRFYDINTWGDYT